MNTQYTQLEIEFGLDKFVQRVNELVSAHYDKNYPNLDKHPVTINPGRKYWKLVTERRVYGFVRKSDGAILKAASWAAPYVKGKNYVRGYVTDSDFGIHAATPFGIKYQTGAGV